MSTIFLLGAGASYGSDGCTPYNPPLGNGEDGLFNKLLSENGVAKYINENDSELAEMFMENFEQGMDSFREKYPSKVTSFHREMARYFIKFIPEQKNLYIKLLN